MSIVEQYEKSVWMMRPIPAASVNSCEKQPPSCRLPQMEEVILLDILILAKGREIEYYAVWELPALLRRLRLRRPDTPTMYY